MNKANFVMTPILLVALVAASSAVAADVCDLTNPKVQAAVANALWVDMQNSPTPAQDNCGMIQQPDEIISNAKNPSIQLIPYRARNSCNGFSRTDECSSPAGEAISFSFESSGYNLNVPAAIDVSDITVEASDNQCIVKMPEESPFFDVYNEKKEKECTSRDFGKTVKITAQNIVVPMKIAQNQGDSSIASLVAGISNFNSSQGQAPPVGNIAYPCGKDESENQNYIVGVSDSNPNPHCILRSAYASALLGPITNKQLLFTGAGNYNAVGAAQVPAAAPAQGQVAPAQ